MRCLLAQHQLQHQRTAATVLLRCLQAKWEQIDGDSRLREGVKKSPISYQKSPVSPQRALCTIERALFSITTVLCVVKRAVFPINRDLFPVKRAKEANFQ